MIEMTLTESGESSEARTYRYADDRLDELLDRADARFATPLAQLDRRLVRERDAAAAERARQWREVRDAR